MNAEQKLHSLISDINARTQCDDDTLTDAVGSLFSCIGHHGSVSIRPLSVTENGQYNVPDNIDGYNPVTVNVPAPSPALQAKSVVPAEIVQVVVADDDYDGLSEVSISAIPEQYIVPEGTLNITANGTYDVAGRETAVVDIQTSAPSVLPSGYTQMEYLESSGTQYIDTGINPTLDTETECECQCLVGYNNYSCVWGTGGNAPYYGILPNLIVNTLTKGYKSSSTYPNLGNSGEQSCSIYPAARSTYVLNKNGLYSNGALMCGLLATELNQPNSIYLFGRNDNNTFARPMYCRIFRYKHRRNGVLIQDFIPAMRNSDSVLGMYDIENEMFYTNAGTGTFTGGALS